MVLICLRSEIGNGISDKKAFLLIKYTHTKRDFRLFGSSFFVHKNIPRLATRDKNTLAHKLLSVVCYLCKKIQYFKIKINNAYDKTIACIPFILSRKPLFNCHLDSFKITHKKRCGDKNANSSEKYADRAVVYCND